MHAEKPAWSFKSLMSLFMTSLRSLCRKEVGLTPNKVRSFFHTVILNKPSNFWQSGKFFRSNSRLSSSISEAVLQLGFNTLVQWLGTIRTKFLWLFVAQTPFQCWGSDMCFKAASFPQASRSIVNPHKGVSAPLPYHQKNELTVGLIAAYFGACVSHIQRSRVTIACVCESFPTPRGKPFLQPCEGRGFESLVSRVWCIWLQNKYRSVPHLSLSSSGTICQLLSSWWSSGGSHDFAPPTWRDKWMSQI